MYKALWLLAASLLIALTSGQRRIPSKPVLENARRSCFRANRFGRRVRFISDQETKCWYYRCSAIRPIAKRCGLGSFISEFYEADDYNPCTEMYDFSNGKQFDCTRKGFDAEGLPKCLEFYNDNDVCKNGAEVKYEGTLCWCSCTDAFTGATCEVPKSGDVNTGRLNIIAPPEIQLSEQAEKTDANRELAIKQSRQKQQTSSVSSIEFQEALPPPPPSVRVGSDGKFHSFDPCPDIKDGIPPVDWCKRAEGLGRGCQNGGTCFNQCTGFYCICRPPFTAGRRCEKYRCIKNVECMNGGTCSRGEDDTDEVATCACPQGFEGSMCETATNA